MITHNITLNVKNQNVVNTGIAVSQGDKGKVKFVIYVKDGDNYLSGAVSAEIAFNTPNGYIVTGNAVVENNSYTYVFEGNELQAAGDISAVITLTFNDGRVSSCGFAFYCRYNPMYDRNIDAGPYFGEIEALKSAAENALSDANGAVAQANAAKNAAEIAAKNAEAVAGIGIATTEKAGISKPDGTTLGIDAAGILRVLASGLKIKDTNGLIGTVNADVFLQSLIDDITNRVVNQILTKTMLVNNALTTVSGQYPADAAYLKTLKDLIDNLTTAVSKLNSELGRFQVYSAESDISEQLTNEQIYQSIFLDLPSGKYLIFSGANCTVLSGYPRICLYVKDSGRLTKLIWTTCMDNLQSACSGTYCVTLQNPCRILIGSQGIGSINLTEYVYLHALRFDN